MPLPSQSPHLFTAGRRASLGSWCCSPSSLSSLGTSFSSSYKDLAKHIVDISMADVRFPVALCWGCGSRADEGFSSSLAPQKGNPVNVVRGSNPRVCFVPCPLIGVWSLCPQVMAACSDNLNNLFSRRAAAGWK